ncbi:WxL protein peptidoglycan domain-containing protein [Nocardioides conyzicola]|uniref:DUF916 domain-containing protein n=1 Tax=Nocardioides conyzicola TaxID=1651781 RepID=A0ABP8X5V5_9ACTN
MPRTRQSRTVVLALLATLLSTVGLVGVGAGTAYAADDDVAWAVRTASNTFGADRQNYRYTVNPGGSVRDGLVVANHGRKPIELAVYAADGFTTDGGQLDLLTPDQKSASIGAWVHADRDTVRIQPGKSVEVPFRLTLPDNATPGDYLGGIITSLRQEGTGANMNVDRRLALKVRLRVGGDLDPGLSVEGLHVSFDGPKNPFGTSGATVDYTIHNTGNAILAAGQKVSVTGPFGRLGVDAADVPDSPELLPGEKWQVSVPIHGLRPAVRLTGTVTLTPLMTDAAGSVNPLAPVDTTTHAWAVPWALLVLLLVVAAGVALGVVLTRRRRAEAKRREDARVQEAVAQAVRESAGAGK